MVKAWERHHLFEFVLVIILCVGSPADDASLETFLFRHKTIGRFCIVRAEQKLTLLHRIYYVRILMGFLEAGTPLEWNDTEEYHKILDYVREHGVLQLLEIFDKVKERRNDTLLWGDEVEFHICAPATGEEDEGIKKGSKNFKIALIAHDVLARLNAEEEELGDASESAWRPEYGSWMIEAVPARPYGGLSGDLLQVEPNMRIRRQRIRSALPPGHDVLAMVSWPLLGVGEFCTPWPENGAGGEFTESLFVPDAIINPHPRFGTLTRNIRRRRGKKVHVSMPLYQDSKTAEGAAGRTVYPVTSQCNKAKSEAREIYMDAMGFGMGCCCLQITFQARDLDESRFLYDQLAVMCPIMLALSAGCPILKGLLADTDVRWSVISQSVDCRTPVEYGCVDEPSIVNDGQVPQRGSMKLRKSRYDAVDMYMSSSEHLKDEYNDNALEIDEKTYEMLTARGMDERLAKHVAHLFVRDPLVIFSERIKVDNAATTEHFENIQSTNWQTMRWKPPPANSEMGWRVEFRPIEVQLTDFENAAYTVFIVLLSRVILFFNLNLYIPISKVDENMDTAHKRDAVLNDKFYFRKKLVPLEEECGPMDAGNNASTSIDTSADDFELMSIKDIICGKGEDFPGLVPLIWAYLDIIDIDKRTREVVGEYIDLIVRRAKGTLPTPARWMRDFVTRHPDYAQDSIVPPNVADDLIQHCLDVSNGKVSDPTLLGTTVVPDIDVERTFGRLSDLTVDKSPLRGSSFRREVGISNQHAYQCAIVRALVEKHKANAASEHTLKINRNFDSTPAFLDSVS